MVSSSKKILIDSICSDEVRAAVLLGDKIVEFEQEFKEKKQLRGNIYVAYVRRIEPSLQAVFIEYGNNKQGFLPFSEISIEYFNIPEEEKELIFEAYAKKNNTHDKINSSNGEESHSLYSVGKEKSIYIKYKLQDVITLNQKILVQLTKEERGHKGASFTTYATLVGRYCVFMPNSDSKGGVSRRIEDVNVRNRLKEILSLLKLHPRSGLIIRTIGADKSKADIEQDYIYLCNLWQNIQKNAFSTHFPSLIYNESDMVMRFVRDLCNQDTQEIIISGREVYEEVKKYFSIIKSRLRIRLYNGSIPIFVYYGVEDQISELYANKVILPSGGSLVIVLTEAFVSIDVNSGKMTGEDNIEETAYKTNMEAVNEISRQVNLRGLSGLIVIDFIGMVKYHYCRAVEYAIKQAFKNDRAKIQFSYINDFGLMVLSRQRIKPNIQEINTKECSHCKGVGKIKSPEVITASIFRSLYYAIDKDKNKNFYLTAHSIVISYIFNNKRDAISAIEKKCNVIISVSIDDSLDVDAFALKVLDNDLPHNNYSNTIAPLKNSGYQSKDYDTDNLEKKVNNFWLTKWLLRLFGSKH
ncbi:Rne/Rng family ribonuclease [Wolbachia endosymbiont of Pentidionis agamae]|uniref:Rne/Rng family ribonuclease n=1 Tax=Wolbachia endosymbiont of Pentidionis agamae TaxID=3110435 RepID=UPI002FD1095E